MVKLLLFNKPYGVLPQFTDKKSPTPRPTLSDYIDVPDVYPAGRLDRDSEGLMILTDNGKLQARISNPKFKMQKTYFVQIEGIPKDADLIPLRQGLKLKDGWTKPALAERIDTPNLWLREPPIRVRKNIPDSWIKLTISEGRNRQIRRMTAAIGFPTLRLVRIQIDEWELNHLTPGEWRFVEIS